MNILQQIATWFATGLLALTGASQLGQSLPDLTALFEDTLATPISSSIETLTLADGEDKDGNNLSGTYVFIIDEGSSKAEQVECACTADACTSCTRGISWTDGSSTSSARMFAHNRGASVKITDIWSLLAQDILDGETCFSNNLCSGNNFYLSSAQTTASSTDLITEGYGDLRYPRAGTATSISAVWTYTAEPIAPTPDGANVYELATVEYVNNVATSGAATMTTTTAGIAKLSVDAASAASPVVVGDNDTRLDHATMGYGNVATTTVTTSIAGTYSAIVWGQTNLPHSTYISLCAKRPNGATTSLALGHAGYSNSGGEGGHSTVTLTGLYTSPTSTTEVIEFYISEDTCANAIGADRSDRSGITYLIIK